jgi:hypothetical protein
LFELPLSPEVKRFTERYGAVKQDYMFSISVRGFVQCRLILIIVLITISIPICKWTRNCIFVRSSASGDSRSSAMQGHEGEASGARESSLLH